MGSKSRGNFGTGGWCGRVDCRWRAAGVRCRRCVRWSLYRAKVNARGISLADILFERLKREVEISEKWSEKLEALKKSKSLAGKYEWTTDGR